MTGHDRSWSRFLVNLTGHKKMTMVMTIRNPGGDTGTLRQSFVDFNLGIPPLALMRYADSAMFPPAQAGNGTIQKN